MNPRCLIFVCGTWTFLCLWGCKKDNATDESKRGYSDKKTTLSTDSEYGTNKEKEFREAAIQVCPRTSPNPALEKLAETAREAAIRLQKASCQTIKVFFRNDRAVFLIPPALGQGRTMELVMKNSPGPAALVDRGEKRFWWGNPAELIDVLEGSPHRFRTLASARFLDSKEDPGFMWNNLPTYRLDAVIEYGRQNPGRLPPHDVRIDLTVWSTQNHEENGSIKQLLLYASLMNLGGKHGWDAMEAVGTKIGFPLKWTIAIRPRHWPEERESVTMMYEILPLKNGRLTKPTTLPANRAALPPGEFQRRFGPIGSPDRQEIPQKRLKPIRPPLGIPGEPRTGEFPVKNSTDRSAAILLDGFRIGTVSPDGHHVFQGFPAGYYRAAAHSPWGTISFGPIDLYIPGKWTLTN